MVLLERVEGQCLKYVSLGGSLMSRDCLVELIFPLDLNILSSVQI